jgi:Holliday junction resolvase RusA-like endonuclease
VTGLPAGPVSFQLWPDPAPAEPDVFDLAVTWSQDPAPQGSKNPRPIWRNKGNGDPAKRPIAISPDGKRELIAITVSASSKHVGPWRDVIKHAARQRRRGAPAITSPVRAVMIFTLHRPANHYRTGRNSVLLTDRAPALPAGYPDVSKLARAVEDALVDAGVLDDDALITGYDRLDKVYPDTRAPAGWSLPAYALQKPGVFIHIERT